jgi:hypothetical protein
VRVPAERLVRLRVAVGLLVVGVDLEDVAVALARDLLGLLAGQPRVPRRLAARAVRARAGEADVLADAVALVVDLDRRRPAERRLVVDEARDVGDAERLCARDLVVVDEDVAAPALADEARGAVRIGRGPLRLPLSAMPSPAAERVSTERRDSPWSFAGADGASGDVAIESLPIVGWTSEGRAAMSSW